ncbi:hypothetical protein J6590_043186 [Homalodisca vitripennis]|nr:hypothetical protein J6590_043186 [Homalodisca vitripennis]
MAHSASRPEPCIQEHTEQSVVSLLSVNRGRLKAGQVMADGSSRKVRVSRSTGGPAEHALTHNQLSWNNVPTYAIGMFYNVPTYAIGMFYTYLRLR